MSPAMRTALKAAVVGALFGAYVVLRDNLPLWRIMPDLDPVSAAARVVGGIACGAILFGLAGYAFGLYRRKPRQIGK